MSEAGASVYSASELAAKEFPDLDVTLRGAVSIARRLQDPLAELVKIDPKAIGVGQYQHDVNQRELARSLDAVVEDCVNAVGVDVNTASVAAARARVGAERDARAQHRRVPRRERAVPVARASAEGAASRRQDLRAGRRLPAHQRRRESARPLVGAPGGVSGRRAHSREDQQARRARCWASARRCAGLSPAEFVDDRFGLPTVRDILAELEKPGRDPRPEFKTATFREGVEKISRPRRRAWCSKAW